MRRVIHNAYVQNWYNNGGTALGDAATGDAVAIRAAQVNEAYRAFGMTDINKPGLANTGYPRMSGNYAVKLIDYWRGEANAALPHASEIPDSAIRSQWLRAVQELKTGVGISSAFGLARASGTTLLPDAMTKVVWDTVDPVVLGMRAIRETPTRWELLKESVLESIPAVANPINRFLTAAKWLGAGLIAYVVYDSYVKRK